MRWRITYLTNDFAIAMCVGVSAEGAFVIFAIRVKGVEGEVSRRRRRTNIRLSQFRVDRRVKRHPNVSLSALLFVFVLLGFFFACFFFREYFFPSFLLVFL